MFAVRGTVAHPTVLLLGTLTNRRGQVVASSCMTVEFPNPANPAFAPVTPYADVVEMANAVGFTGTLHNPGAVGDLGTHQPLLARAVRAGSVEIEVLMAEAVKAAVLRLEGWQARASAWTDQSDKLPQMASVRDRRTTVAEENRLAEQMAPDRSLVRPLLLVLPQDHPVAQDHLFNGRSEG